MIGQLRCRHKISPVCDGRHNRGRATLFSGRTATGTGECVGVIDTSDELDPSLSVTAGRIRVRDCAALLPHAGTRIGSWVTETGPAASRRSRIRVTPAAGTARALVAAVPPDSAQRLRPESLGTRVRIDG
jgi:hypothetical protein